MHINKYTLQYLNRKETQLTWKVYLNWGERNRWKLWISMNNINVYNNAVSKRYDFSDNGGSLYGENGWIDRVLSLAFRLARHSYDLFSKFTNPKEWMQKGAARPTSLCPLYKVPALLFITYSVIEFSYVWVVHYILCICKHKWEENGNIKLYTHKYINKISNNNELWILIAMEIEKWKWNNI